MPLPPTFERQTLPSGPSRLTHRRLRRPTRLPSLNSRSFFGRYLDRLGWLFGAA